MSGAPIEKLLSHRLRGFAPFEHSPAALAAACAESIKYLEVDTRVTLDGSIVVYHNPKLGPDTSGTGLIAGITRDRLQTITFADGQPLLGLDQLLDYFSSHAKPDTLLCLDIKDCGYENEHLEAVRQAGLEPRVIFISWIPQTLRRLADLGARSPLILSHLNLASWGLAGAVLERILARRRLRLDRYVLFGKSRTSEPLGMLSHGFQHALVCRSLPDDLTAILTRSGGGVCVPVWLVSGRLIRYCRSLRLHLWVYSVNAAGPFRRYAAMEGIDVVFCDSASAVIGTLRSR